MSIQNAFYERENAGDYFSQLIGISASSDNLRRKYAKLAKLFNRLINNATAETSLILSGPFAKTDYLLKNLNAGQSLQLMVNDARNHMHRTDTIADTALPILLQCDIEAVARFTALIFRCTVPADVENLFPKIRPQRHGGARIADYIRLIVTSFDNKHIYGNSPEYPGIKLKIAYSADDDYGFDYIQDLLNEGSQINIISPRKDTNGVIRPELIILEPDILTDVSGVAACFESYGSDPLISLIKRLQPLAEGDAINLGNFAGQLLDETIHHEDTSYTDSAIRFFRNNALSLAINPPRPEFHNDARRQLQNIRRAINELMPAQIDSFDPGQLMVEPSFFSEMLGLQGRMDFLQLDMQLLVEQKSGKGEWPYGDFSSPRARKPHYVQLLLYMAIIRYNYAREYKLNNGRLQAFLMYSKYSSSLLGLGFAPALLREAIEMRNRMVAAELQYSEKGFGFLTDTDAESLNHKGSSSLWQNYSLPAINSILQPIKKAGSTERSYFMRMMRFVAREHILAKVGNKQKEGSGFAATWHDSLDEKLDSGNIYTGLKLNNNFSDNEKIDTLLLSFTEGDACEMANFRVSDTVILYPYRPGQIPDARRNMVFRCSIKEISSNNICLKLRFPQSGKAPFEKHKGELWAIEHDFIESSFSSLYRGLHALLTASQRRRDLLFFRREPETDHSRQLIGDYGKFNELAQHVASARDLFLIIGPPGTGKTSFGMLTTVCEELEHDDSNILVLAYTNRAVDEICSKLIESGIEFIRIGNELSCAESNRHTLLSNKMNSCPNSATLLNELKRNRVFVATTTALNSNTALFKIKHFSLAVIDEASQILEPQIAGILAARHDGRDAIDKFVFIGDHKQLPAIVGQTAEESAVDEACLHKIGLFNCRESLFQRLSTRYADNPDVCYMLTRQGRMHRDIAEFASINFYEGRLKEVPLPHQTAELESNLSDTGNLSELIKTHRLLFFDVKAPEESPSDKVNLHEARLIASVLAEIRQREGDDFDPDDTVGVIVPYRNQISAIRNELRKLNLDGVSDICIDTVERYQGSQRKYIIYGFTVQKYYQLQFLTSNVFEENGYIIDRKLNVAMTRAREHLILTGDSRLLRRNVTFSRLIDFIKLKRGYFTD